MKALSTIGAAITFAAGIATCDLSNATVLAGSDLHAWPGPPSTAMASFTWAARRFKPDIIVLDGDVLDGATISRFPRTGWDHRPTLLEEITAAQGLLTGIRKAAPQARRVFIRGNHDDRVETYLYREPRREA
jgi:predicted MPP superfamily phosphohydrolase